MPTYSVPSPEVMDDQEYSSGISSVDLELTGVKWPGPGTKERMNSTADKEEDRIQKLTGAVRTIIECIGEDPDRDGLGKTPEQYAKAILSLTDGYQKSVLGVMEDATFHKESSTDIVIINAIGIYSLCEHMFPLTGKVHIGYIPNGRTMEFSKVTELVRMLAHRLQDQERLTRQIADVLSEILAPFGVGVIIKANHLCDGIRDVEKLGSVTVTKCMIGCMKSDESLCEEFMANIQKK